MENINQNISSEIKKLAEPESSLIERAKEIKAQLEQLALDFQSNGRSLDVTASYRSLSSDKKEFFKFTIITEINPDLIIFKP